MKRIVLYLAALIAAQLVCAQTLAQVYDQIKLKNGAVHLPGQRITVIEDTWKVVRYDIKGGAKGAVPQATVAEIMWGDAPSDYRTAEGHRKKNEFTEAVTFYEKALRSTLGREWWIKPYSLYYLAFCNLQAGKSADAEKHYKRLIRVHPNAKFYPNAHIDLGDIYLSGKMYDKASASFNLVMEVDPEGQPIFDKDLYFLARLKAVDAHIGTKAFDKARSEVNALKRELPETHTHLIRSAKQKHALIAILSGKIDEGVKEYRRIIEETIKEMGSGGSEKEARLMHALAQCYNGLGDAFLKNPGRKERFKEALMEYLRVVTVMGESVGLEYARALKGAVECFEAIGKKDRAAALRKELKARFRGYR